MSESDYYQTLCKALSDAGIAYPVLLIDHQRLSNNLNRLRESIEGNFRYRIVAKSLPSLPLLDLIMKETGTRRLMCFHLPFLMDLVSHFQDADILIGKPLPCAALKQFYTWLMEQSNSSFAPEKQLQWLVDSEERLREYESLAKSLEITLRVNLEVDIGLHRGGFNDLEGFTSCLRLIEQSEHLNFGGIMGYEAHITKIPGVLGGPSNAFQKARTRYSEFVSRIEQTISAAPNDLCLNTGGSTTFPMYTPNKAEETNSANELAAASALVKPSDFDVETLLDYEPAAFIASPVLKRVERPLLPGPELVSKTLRQLGILPSSAVFIYGGNWLADPVFPPGSKPIKAFGHSSNQEMYSWDTSPVNEQSYMIFRPRQSEAVLLQFGKIALFNGGRISDWWQTLTYPEALYTSLP